MVMPSGTGPGDDLNTQYAQEGAQASLAQAQRDAQVRLHEAQMAASAAVAGAEAQATQQLAARREAVERLKMQLANELAQTEQRLEGEYNRLLQTGYTHVRINESAQPLPLPGS